MANFLLRSLAANVMVGAKTNSFLYSPTKFIMRSIIITNLDNLDTSIKVKKVSKAMKAYLEKAREHDSFMKQQDYEYKIGKRHLANMMGEDPETFTQEDVDRAIQYLFPSGIYDLYARPMMKPPDEVFPARKLAEFDEAGRPHHFLYYTTKCNFHHMLYDIYEQQEELYRYEDQQIRKNLKPNPDKAIELIGSTWIDKLELETQTVEKLSEKDYNMFVFALERLLQTPYSYRIRDFIFKFRKNVISLQTTFDIPKPLIGEDGRKYTTIYECLKKKCRGDVTIRSPGTGKISINGQDITYFEDIQPREQILFPLLFTEMLNSVDVECNVEGGGPSSQSNALRWGIAMGLRSFVEPEMIEKLRIAGLLTRDYRRKERKKVCQPGARKKHTWKKR